MKTGIIASTLWGRVPEQFTIIHIVFAYYIHIFLMYIYLSFQTIYVEISCTFYYNVLYYICFMVEL